MMGVLIVLTDYDLTNPINQVLYFAMKAVFYTVAIASSSIAVHSYHKKGLSKQFRNLLMKRHIAFCILSFVC